MPPKGKRRVEDTASVSSEPPPTGATTRSRPAAQPAASSRAQPTSRSETAPTPPYNWFSQTVQEEQEAEENEDSEDDAEETPTAESLFADQLIVVEKQLVESISFLLDNQKEISPIYTSLLEGFDGK